MSERSDLYFDGGRRPSRKGSNAIEILNKTGGTVSLTCGLPLYRSGEIAWLALESLCRQQSVDFEWELIICEEVREYRTPPSTTDAIKAVGILEYVERLSDAGCSRILYEPLGEWIPLSDKWVKIASIADSEGFLLVASDCYSHPLRLATSKRLFDECNEWIQTPVGAFYDIMEESISIFDHGLAKKSSIPGHRIHPCALNMGLRTEIIKCAPKAGKMKSVDSWMYGHARKSLSRHPIVGIDKSTDWMRGVDTHGYNNISLSRGRLLASADSAPKPPFRLPVSGEPSSIVDAVPDDIAQRLMDLPKRLPQTVQPGPKPSRSAEYSRKRDMLNNRS